MVYQVRKKWSDKEITQILNYVLQEGKFESPTTKIYYTKLLKDLNMNGKWDKLKFKMQYLKRSFQKADAWQKSALADTLISDGDRRSIREEVLKKCPHYDMLYQIYGGIDEDDDDPQDSTMSENSILSMDLMDFEEKEVFLPKTSRNNTFETPSEQTSKVVDKRHMPRFSLSGVAKTESVGIDSNVLVNSVKSVLEQLNALQAARMEFNKKKLDLEYRKLELEERKLENQRRLQEEQLKQEFSIRKLEIEKNERVACYEIQLKYGSSQNIPYN